MDRPLPARLLAEFVGALALVFIASGSVLAAGSGAPGTGLVTIAIAYGLTVAAMVAALRHVSGGHLNPAVTIAAWVTQRIGAGTAFCYVVAQLAGGAAGAGLLRASVPDAVWRQDGVKLGATLVNPAVSGGQAVLIEAVLTFFLVWVFFATMIDPEGAPRAVAGLAIGAVVLAGVMMGGPFTGASMNPARTFGPALAGGFWAGHWVYWVGPVAGGIVAASTYDAAVLRPRADRAER
ncbi:MAG: MIP family channel protein [Acidobacteria bacterium]|nr:MIP family channel protein [Acidobacteriota bacterium]